MKLLYRADGGHPIGTGHLYRAVRLMRSLAESGLLDAVLLVGEDPAALRIAQSAPARVAVAPPSFGPESVKPVLHAAPLLEILERERFDLIAIDMLDTPHAEMAALAAAGILLLSFDDRGKGRIFANTLINVLVEEPDPGSLPRPIRLLQGLEYAVLDPVYAAARGAYGREVREMRQVFVTLGGGDAAGLAVKVARALRRVPALEQVDFAVGPAFVHRAELEETLAAAPWRHAIHVALPNLLDRFLSCDLAIVAGGLTMLEACCVGVPALAVCQSIDHQLELSGRLADRGAMRTVGYGELLSEEELTEAVSRLRDRGARERMSLNGPRLVDGQGTERTAAAMRLAAVPGEKLRECNR